jgi:parallel beta-helix repeat protein
MIFFLLIVFSSGVELPARGEPANVIVGPTDSIQAAINNATVGSTILVSAGIYNESLQIDKSISLIGEGMDQTVINGQNRQFIINITADYVTIESFTIQSGFNPSYGINMFGCRGDTISYNIVEDSQEGIALTSCIDATVSDNTITANAQQGIYLTSCKQNTISDNSITANAQGGISLVFSNNNFFSENMVSGNNGGFSIYLSPSNVFSGNTFAANSPTDETIQSYSYYNVFYDNNFNDSVQIDATSSPNTWYNMSTLDGNYWNSYKGHDLGNGIGMQSYTVAPGNVDPHPLMGQFQSFNAALGAETYQISIMSNSTISGFNLELGTETGNKIIQFNVTGAEGSVGFSRVTIPTALMNTSVVVLVGEKEVAPIWLSSQSVGFNYLYLTYAQTNQTVLIISSETMDLYNQLLNEYIALNATYYELLSLNTTQLQMDLQNLNNTYNGLLNSYASLLGNYSQLQQTYLSLSASYQQHVQNYDQNLQNVRSIMYIFAAAAAILILITVYFSKHAFSRSTKAPEQENQFSATRFVV